MQSEVEYLQRMGVELTTLTTLLAPTSGTITLNGFDVTKERLDTRKSFGIVFQDPSLDTELTAYENMEIHAVLYGQPRELRRGRTRELLERTGTGSLEDAFLQLTGKTIRPEEASATDGLRQVARMWRR